MGRRRVLSKKVMIAASMSNRINLQQDALDQSHSIPVPHCFPLESMEPVNDETIPDVLFRDDALEFNTDSESSGDEEVSPEYERMVVADETLWKTLRFDIKKRLLLRLVPSFHTQCTTCAIKQSEIYCKTCYSLQCVECCMKSHEHVFCHDLHQTHPLLGLTEYHLPIKTLIECSIECVKPRKDVKIRLVDLKGRFQTISLTIASETVNINQCQCSIGILADRGFFASTRGGIIQAGFAVDLLALFRSLNLKCAISTTHFYQTIQCIIYSWN